MPLKSLAANKPELKLASIIASIATVAVVSTTIWISFFSDDDKTHTPERQPVAVEVTEKPAVPPLVKKPETDTPTISNATIPQKELSIQKTPPPKQVVVGQGDLYVQVGAFKQLNLARTLLKKMKKKYKRAEIFTKSNLHLVWVGPVATKEEALRLSTNIERYDQIKGFITSKKQTMM